MEGVTHRHRDRSSEKKRNHRSIVEIRVCDKMVRLQAVRTLAPLVVFLVLITASLLVAYRLVGGSGRAITLPEHLSPVPHRVLATKTEPCLPLLKKCSTADDCASCEETVMTCTSAPAGTQVEFEGTVVTVDTEEPVCLPAYLGRCNPFTSNTFLSRDVLGRPSWTCACRPELTRAFRQAVAGGSCDVEMACGAETPALHSSGGALVPMLFSVYTGDDSAGEPVFESRPVYANRLVSDDEEECWYRTKTLASGEVQPADDADPTCVPLLLSPTCTVSVGLDKAQVVRDGPPRVSPQWARPVPPGLQRCPDGWTGDGTAVAVCTSPAGAQLPPYFGADGEWAGSVTSLAALRAVAPKTPWRGITTIYASELNCLEQPSFGTGPSLYCKGATCKAAKGRRRRAWDGERDGPLLGPDLQPFGATCACDAPGDAQGAGLTCVPDLCNTGGRFPGAYRDGDACVCPGGLSFKPQQTPVVCVTDPCAPLGTHHAPQLACDTDAHCGGVCVASQCYIPTSKKCASALDCDAMLLGLNGTTACVEGTCLVLDQRRKATTCKGSSECGYGACVAGTCRGGCACDVGSHQEPDGGRSPLGVSCVSNCTPNPCLNGGTCVTAANGDATCTCVNDFTGARCETNWCVEPYHACNGSRPCCTDSLQYYETVTCEGDIPFCNVRVSHNYDDSEQ